MQCMLILYPRLHEFQCSHGLLISFAGSIFLKSAALVHRQFPTVYSHLGALHGWDTCDHFSRANKKSYTTNDYFSDWDGLYKTSYKKRIRLSKSNWLRIYIFQAKWHCWKDTRLRFAYASAQHYARCPEEGNLRFTNSILTLALDNKTGYCFLKHDFSSVFCDR